MHHEEFISWKGQSRTRKTSDYSHQHNTAIKGDRTKQKKKKDCSVSRTELEVGKVDRKATSEEPGLLRMGKRTINNNCSLNAHTVEGSVGKEELKNQLQRTHSHKDK